MELEEIGNYNYINVPFIKENDISEDGTFTGYGSIFDESPDSYGHIIAKGAFTQTIINGGRNRTGIAMLWQHDSHTPIGIWKEIKQDDKGLFVCGELIKEVQKGNEAYVLMKKKALRGLSIGWDYMRDSKGNVKKDSYIDDEKKGIRLLKEIELWEISPVTFPAKRTARIIGVKTFEGIETERELENVLRELGCSKSAAQYLVKLCRPSLRESKSREDKVCEMLNPILASLKQVNMGLEISRQIYK